MHGMNFRPFYTFMLVFGFYDVISHLRWLHVYIQVALSVLLTAIGCIIAAIGDFSFDLFGYSLALTSVFCQVIISVFSL